MSKGTDWRHYGTKAYGDNWVVYIHGRCRFLTLHATQQQAQEVVEDFNAGLTPAQIARWGLCVAQLKHWMAKEYHGD